MVEKVSKWELPVRSMKSKVAYQLIHDELQLDGNPRLNLATFCNEVYMEPEAEKLMIESLGKNFIDQDEYPQTKEIEDRCVNIIANLFHSPAPLGHAVGCSTVGSSEAVMLAGMAFKWRWKQRKIAAGIPKEKWGEPNIIFGANVQVVWKKFARYWEVEPRYVHLTNTRYTIGVDEALSLVDENTIAICMVLGSTYTGEYEPVAELHEKLVKLNQEKGWQVPMHVDAASGGFVAPFLNPDLVWDFQLPLVKSINVSGHKYGMVYPGVGWAIWREKEDLPEELLFHVGYLGGDQATFTLNFSKGASQIIGQYYNLIRLGFHGYQRIMSTLRSNAIAFAEGLEQLGLFELISKHLTDLPLVAFKLKDETHYTIFDLSDQLRARGWQIPAYKLAEDAEHIRIMRVVVQESFSIDMAERLLVDMKKAIEYLEKHFRSVENRVKREERKLTSFVHL